MGHDIPWDAIVVHYNKLFSSSEGRPPISGRVILGAIIIKHIEGLSDRKTIQHIRENMFMQYFLGYTSFTNEEPFSDTLFVEIRKRLNLELLSKINDVIVLHCLQENETPLPPPTKRENNESPFDTTLQDEEVLVVTDNITGQTLPQGQEKVIQQQSDDTTATTPGNNSGRLITDATVAPQNITYPTDLKLLNASREKSEELIDILYNPLLHGHTKPRTYRKVARKAFLNTAKKKQKSSKVIYKSNGQQLRFLRRNLAHIEQLLTAYKTFPLKPKELKYLMVLYTVYDQQHHMHSTHQACGLQDCQHSPASCTSHCKEQKK